MGIFVGIFGTLILHFGFGIIAGDLEIRQDSDASSLKGEESDNLITETTPEGKTPCVQTGYC